MSGGVIKSRKALIHFQSDLSNVAMDDEKGTTIPFWNVLLLDSGC